MTWSSVSPDWSNPSVLAFAGERDPLEVATNAALELTEIAREAGLAGPPVDVLALAREVGITLRPSAEGWDASIAKRDDLTVTTAPTDLRSRAQQLVIDYDPSRSRGRLRFSIAHELAHACFPDVGTKTRHRSALGAVERAASSNEWELELLCNVIAAELVLPADAVDGLLDVPLDIDFLMETRRRWDVSTEALLRRIVGGMSRPVVLIATSRAGVRSDSSFRVDYAFGSPSAGGALPQLHHGQTLLDDSTLRACVAVGQTVKGYISINGQPLRIQSAGAPPYPGSSYPRVLALLEPEREIVPRDGLSYVTSDLLELPPAASPIIIAHVVSDSVRGWSRTGASGALARAFPDIAGSYRSWTIASPNNLSLGNVHSVGRDVGGRYVEVASVVAQHGYGAVSGPRLRYDALAEGLDTVAARAAARSAIVHVPRLGAGRAGGRWDLIEDLLVEKLTRKGVEVVVHTLPSLPLGSSGMVP
jgi:hypothetical protein